MTRQIAIATTDGVSVADHLARCAAFLIIDIESGAREWRQRDTDQCGNHRSFLDLAAGCRAILCGGVGAGAANALAARGVDCLVLRSPMTIEGALKGYVAGTLDTTDERVCLCG